MQRVVTDKQIETIQEMAKKGVRNRDIAKAVDLSNPVVSYWVKKAKGYKSVIKKKTNTCTGCKYYGRGTCDYILIMNKSRKCNPQNCECREEGEYIGNNQKIGRMCIHKPPRSQMHKYIYSQSLFDWEMYDEDE